MSKPSILIIAGTPDAAVLSRDLSARPDLAPLHVAVVGEEAAPPFGRATVTRIGGYRDPGDLVAEIRRFGIGAIVDASDPYDTRTARLARAASEATGIPRLVLCRPVWSRHPLDRRIEVDGLDGAARVVADVARRALLALPEADARHFARSAGAGVACIARLDRAPSGPLHALRDVDVDPGPYARAGEAARLARHGVGTVVLRATGCDRLGPLLAAARAADLPVIMIRRPLPVPGARAETMADAVEWVEGTPGRTTIRLPAPP